MLVLTVVELPLQFIEIGRKTLHAQLVIGADDGTLEQAPRGLDAVGGHVTPNPFLLGVIDGLMAGPVMILKHNRPVGVIVDAERYDHMKELVDRIEDLEDEIALLRTKLDPSPPIPHEDVVRGLDQE